jgi:nucleoside recognition membrane protein YjiH
METLAPPLLAVLGIYLLIGFFFAIPFAIIAAKKIEPSAAGGTWGFKLLIIPGSAIFWPLLLKRWILNSSPPEECSAHRNAAKSSAPTD